MTIRVTARASTRLLRSQWPCLQKRQKHAAASSPAKWKIVKSDKDNYGVYNDDNKTLFTEVAMLLNDGDPLAIK
jgi:hypothetical protein